MSTPKLETAAVLITLSPSVLDKVKATFKTVYYHPDGSLPSADEMKGVDVWATGHQGLGDKVKELKEVQSSKLIQLASAGANNSLKMELLKNEEARKQISVCTSSGIHVFAIPQYAISMIINLYMSHHHQIYRTRNEQRWLQGELAKQSIMSDDGKGLDHRSLYGRTAGMLGYGHIGRETARLLKAFNVTIIAANSSGTKREDDGYVIAGTGDKDGSIPEKFYSTKDPASFKEFMSRCDILFASLPSTPQTTWLLKEEHLKQMPDKSVFVNVGRGDLVHSDDVIAALDAPGGLAGAALDVTDPEPLPDKHPLYTHPRVIITPHTSGAFKGYNDAVGDLLVAQAERIRSGGKPYNVVDFERGY